MSGGCEYCDNKSEKEIKNSADKSAATIAKNGAIKIINQPRYTNIISPTIATAIQNVSNV